MLFNAFIMIELFIFQGELVKYTSDPLQDFTLIRFLDRFVFKNPKKKEESKYLIYLKMDII